MRGIQRLPRNPWKFLSKLVGRTSAIGSNQMYRALLGLSVLTSFNGPNLIEWEHIDPAEFVTQI